MTVFALLMGVVAGVEYYKTFDEFAEAIIVTLTTTEILFHVMDVVENLLRAFTASIPASSLYRTVRRLLRQVHRLAGKTRDLIRDVLDRFFGGGAGGFAALVRGMA